MKEIIKLLNDKRYDIRYNGDTGTNNGVLLYDYPEISQAKKNYNTYVIPGRDGELIENYDYKGNITIRCVFSIFSSSFLPSIRKLKKWLRGTGQLVLSDTPDTFYEVLKIEYENIERELRQYGRFTVLFTCMPYEYAIDGTRPVKSLKYNPYDRCKPIYKIIGEGLCSLTVNGKAFTANVGQNVIIDSEKMLSYRIDGRMMNTEVSGDYKDLWLLHGENKIAVTNGFLLEITPKWGYEV